jgi:hypothetical protein
MGPIRAQLRQYMQNETSIAPCTTELSTCKLENTGVLQVLTVCCFDLILKAMSFDIRGPSTEFLTKFTSIHRSVPHLWKIKCKDYSDRNRKEEAYEILVSKLKEIKSLADSTVTSFFSSPRIRHQYVPASFMALSTSSSLFPRLLCRIICGCLQMRVPSILWRFCLSFPLFSSAFFVQ